MNIGEKSPFCSGRMRQGPSFRFFARPREDVITDVVKAKRKARESVLSRSRQLKIISPSSASFPSALAIRLVMISVDGTASLG